MVGGSLEGTSLNPPCMMEGGSTVALQAESQLSLLFATLTSLP